MRSLRLQIIDTVADEKTIWYFREILTKKGKVEILFEFCSFLIEQGVIAHSRNIVYVIFA